MPEAPADARRFPWADHLGTILTAGYLLLVAIGMFHSLLGYRHFGINILDYAEASDFLLAPFHDPMVMLVTVLPAFLAWRYLVFVERMSRRATERRRATGQGLAWWESSDAAKARMRPYVPVMSVALGLFWVFVSASSYQRINAYRAMRGLGTNVTLELSDGTLEQGTDARPLVLIGTTGRYVFLFRTQEFRTVIVPTESVQRILPIGSLPASTVERRQRTWERLDRSQRDTAAP
ncbi:MAG: hypothetical protein IPK85_11600 [Gemmatimonadetes bacterium]|nr:hypothetical protein [Gemmatimonadota bacterium]